MLYWNIKNTSKEIRQMKRFLTTVLTVILTIVLAAGAAAGFIFISKVQTIKRGGSE